MPTAAPLAGANIPHLSDPMMPQDRLVVTVTDPGDLEVLESARQKLFAAREKRVHPGKDDKILTDWNGLMIASLAKAAAALDEPQYADAAEAAAEFILRQLRTADDRLLHRYRQGEASITANQDDYAFFIWGLIETYEATFDADHLQAALQLTDDMIRHYWDEAGGGFFFTPDDGEDILIRQKPVYDGAVPSGNSVMAWNLLRLARLTSRPEYEDKAARTHQAFAPEVAKAPLAYTQMLTALDFAIGPALRGRRRRPRPGRKHSSHAGRPPAHVPAEQGGPAPPDGRGFPHPSPGSPPSRLSRLATTATHWPTSAETSSARLPPPTSTA